ncbi:MAG: hypothetical protein AAGA18_07295 [Verrucomicrobiota bacterium]
MELQFDSEKKSLSLFFQGDLSSNNVIEKIEPIEDTLKRIRGMSEKWCSLKINLIQTKLIDSTGLNLIISLIKFAKSLDAEIEILVSSIHVDRVLKKINFLGKEIKVRKVGNPH